MLKTMIVQTKNLKKIYIPIFRNYSDIHNIEKNDGFQVVSRNHVCSASYFTCNKHNGTRSNIKFSFRKQNII